MTTWRAILTEGHPRRALCLRDALLFVRRARWREAALDLGFYLSMSGIAAFPEVRDLRDIFAAAPLDRILVETDSPYLAPPPHRGRRNEPAYTAHTARSAPRFSGLSDADFAAARPRPISTACFQGAACGDGRLMARTASPSLAAGRRAGCRASAGTGATAIPTNPQEPPPPLFDAGRADARRAARRGC